MNKLQKYGKPTAITVAVIGGLWLAPDLSKIIANATGLILGNVFGVALLSICFFFGLKILIEANNYKNDADRWLGIAIICGVITLACIADHPFEFAKAVAGKR
ncbi:Ca2+/Na+ antiporter [Rhodoblastus acidophilus]|uniref:hypothetical protein n=1 Tax=Rhodoblastus acidophilus TaxID=1074 RepID=UPI00222400C4|nr:hypothetical protein [Rhodoblastus acidophilus]MCW2317450.1 Ca2+/Na+ antiporter [Rhodoblastus acidophilus]